MHGERASRLLGVVAALTAVVVVIAGAVTVGRSVFGAESFVRVYLDALGRGDVAAALAMPGASGSGEALPVVSSSGGGSGAGALLTGAARTPIDVISVREVSAQAGVHVIEVDWASAGQSARTQLRVAEEGTRGLLFPGWRFVDPPLATASISSAGDPRVDVGALRLDVPDEATFLLAVPGRYDIGHTSPYLEAEPVVVMADRVDGSASVRVVAQPTQLLVDDVVAAIHDFLDACAAQPVLYPTGCPFGREVDEQVISDPVWTITSYPELSFATRKSDFRAQGDGEVALRVRIRKIADGTRRWLDDDIAFRLGLTVSITADDELVVLPDDRLSVL